jgi:hypothetical protein
MTVSKSLFLCCALVASHLAMASTIVPSDPVQFERVSLRQTVDSCAFDPSVVSVSFESSSITVVEPPRLCLIPGPPAVVDIQLGAFPAGVYRVAIHHALTQPAIETLTFTVSGLVQGAVFPPPPGPLANYTDLWWTPAESGWGLSLNQGNTNILFGSLYIYGADQQPQWYTLGSGQWQSSTRWSGDVIKTRGPFWSDPVWNPAVVQNTVVGRATLDFSMTPGHVDRAAFTYSIDGTTVTKEIQRIRF